MFCHQEYVVNSTVSDAFSPLFVKRQEKYARSVPQNQLSRSLRLPPNCADVPSSVIVESERIKHLRTKQEEFLGQITELSFEGSRVQSTLARDSKRLNLAAGEFSRCKSQGDTQKVNIQLDIIKSRMEHIIAQNQSRMTDQVEFLSKKYLI